ncbi:MAG TPA: hypothetical protein VH418_05635 [Solirubrobacteraceae bacterium]|jgi:hypothetical protein
MSATPLLVTSHAVQPVAQVVVDPVVGSPELAELQRAAAVARDRIAALPAVRVLGADVAATSAAEGVRLAVDVRDTGRDGWQVACALARRGIGVEAAAGRALVLRLRSRDVAEGMHERLAPALLQALWSTPARAGFELVLDPPDRHTARTRARRR